MKSEKIVNAIGQIKDEYIVEAHENKKRKFNFQFSWALVGKIAAAAAAILLIINILPDFNHYKEAGSSAAADYREDSYYSNAYEGALYDEEASYYAMDSGAAPAAGNSSSNNISDVVSNQNKKLILNASMQMESQEFDQTLATLKEKVAGAGGYFQSSSVSQRNSSRYYTATIRIPADQYDSFIEGLEGAGNTISYQESVRDVTDSYTDIEARLTSLKAQEAKVLEFYGKAETIEDLMAVESRLSDIRYEIEYYEAQIKNYDLLVAYSTLDITIQETKTYTPVSQSFFTRLGRAFTNGFSEFVDGVGDFIIDLVYNMWTILLFVLIAAAAFFIYRKIRNRKNKAQ